VARNHRKLRVFHDAHKLTLAIYRQTKGFPKDEWFGMRDYLHFLYIALGSACELQYLAGLAVDLEPIPGGVGIQLADRCDHVVRQLERLVESMEDAMAAEREHKNRVGRQ
jgi:hypothetical protein